MKYYPIAFLTGGPLFSLQIFKGILIGCLGFTASWVVLFKWMGGCVHLKFLGNAYMHNWIEWGRLGTTWKSYASIQLDLSKKFFDSIRLIVFKFDSTFDLDL